MTTYTELRAKVEAFLDSAIQEFYQRAPQAAHLRDAEKVDLAYFKRHTIETILRIRLARVADGKAIAVMAQSNPRAAALWARYAEEEMMHDRLFLKDLENLGVSAQEVYSTDPFPATKLLQGYFYYTLEHEGALALLAKAYFVEYTTIKTQGEWNRNIAKSLGEKSIRGAQAHLNIDDNADHTLDVWNALTLLIKEPADEERILKHMKVYAQLFAAYFADLSEFTRQGGVPRAADMNASANARALASQSASEEGVPVSA